MKTIKGWVGIGTFFALMLIMLMLASEGRTVPYFSRKYSTSCVTCHEAFPKRNAVGEGFRMRGFRFVDDDIYRKQEDVAQAKEAYAKASELYAGGAGNHTQWTALMTRMAELTDKLQNITRYETMPYADQTQIIDIHKASRA